MFIGHFAAGFASKKLAPQTSLGTLFLAAQLSDLIWPTLVLFEVEKVEIEPGNTAFTPLDFVSYPYSHSLVALILWAVAIGGIYWFVRRSIRGSLVVAGLVVSHWVLDVVTHRPDVPVGLSNETLLGFGLWNHVAVTLVVEGALFVGGLALYLMATAPRDRVGKIALWSLVAFLLIIYAANVLGPPPPSVTAIAVAGHAIWLLVLWGYWVDRHRRAVEPIE